MIQAARKLRGLLIGIGLRFEIFKSLRGSRNNLVKYENFAISASRIKLQPSVMQKPVYWHFSIDPLADFLAYFETEFFNPAFCLRFEIYLPIKHLETS